MLVPINSVVFVVAVSVIPVLSLAFHVRRYLRLRHVPGPFLASLTDFWLAYKYWTGEYYQDVITELHQRYGPVVRWGPNRVSFASPYAQDQIYSNKDVWKKSESYLAMTVVANGKEISSIVTTRDEKRASHLKRSTNGGFSQAAVLRQEEKIDKIMIQFLDILKAMEGQVIPLSEMLKWWSFDTINRVGFSDDLGFMAAGADIRNVMAAIAQRFQHGRLWFMMPWLEWMLFKNPIVNRFGVSQSMLAKFAVKRIQDRENRDEKTLDHETDLLSVFLAAHRKEPNVISKQNVIGLTLSTINAGSDTTASTTAAIFMNLLKNPSTLAKLENELITAELTAPVAYGQVASLPYLDACIRESLRMNPTSAGTFEREVPAGGATVCGVWLPEGTDTSVSMHQSEFESEVFGSDSNVFRPERWIEADKDRFNLMDHYSLGFGKGRRMCLGIHLARVEMKKLIASLVILWKISPAEKPSVRWNMNQQDVHLKVRLQRRDNA